MQFPAGLQVSFFIFLFFFFLWGFGHWYSIYSITTWNSPWIDRSHHSYHSLSFRDQSIWALDKKYQHLSFVMSSENVFFTLKFTQLVFAVCHHHHHYCYSYCGTVASTPSYRSATSHSAACIQTFNNNNNNKNIVGAKMKKGKRIHHQLNVYSRHLKCMKNKWLQQQSAHTAQPLNP